MKQILTEQAFTHPNFQILVRRGNHPHVDLDRRMPAHPIELAVGQHPQQAGLHLRRHIADLVQKQGAAIGLLEAAASLCRRAGEGATLMAEQFGFQQVLGDGGGIQRNKGPGRARAVAMQSACDQLLAAT